MKKIIGLTIVLALLSTQAFAVALTATAAQDGMTLRATDPATIDIGKTSKGVRIAVQYTGTAYAMQTVHKNGSKYYGSAYDSTAIFVRTPPGDIGLTFAAPTTSVGATAFPTASGWAAL